MSEWLARRRLLEARGRELPVRGKGHTTARAKMRTTLTLRANDDGVVVYF